MSTLKTPNLNHLVRDSARDVIRDTFVKGGLPYAALKPYLDHQRWDSECLLFSFQDWDVTPDWAETSSNEEESDPVNTAASNRRKKIIREASKRVFGIGKMRKQVLILFLHLRLEKNDMAVEDGAVERLLIMLDARPYELAQAKSEFNPDDSRQKTRAKERLTEQLLEELQRLKPAA